MIRHTFLSCVCVLALAGLCPPATAQNPGPGDILINEFVATNQFGIQDEDGDYEDWIELKNGTGSNLSLGDLYLTDATDDLLKWKFPNISLNAGEYLLVYASGKDRATAGQELHANFKIDREGEYLALVNSASAVIDEVSPLFPLQHPGYSYGWDASLNLRYLAPTTPGDSNASATSYLGFVDDIAFSVESGFFEAAFDLSMSTTDSEAQIYYTVDATTPTTTNGTLYSSPVPIGDTTVIRAQAFRDNYVPSNIAARSYLFHLTEVQKSLPIVSVVTSPDNLVGRYGIFDDSLEYAPLNPDGRSNVWQRGRAWERPAHMEWFNGAGTSAFNVPCGVRLHASDSARNSVAPHTKNSLRVYFREVYGAREVTYPIVPRSDVSRYERLVLRAGKNDDFNPFIKDEMIRRTFAEMGNVSSQGTFAHFFLNGEHKGYYNPVERLDDDFMREHHGGTNEWDVIRQGSVAADGDNAEWLSFLDFMKNNDLSIEANYLEADSRFDIRGFIDYLLCNVYASMHDWPTNNWTAAREKIAGAKWRFYVWDAEWCFVENPVQDWFEERLLPPESAEIPSLFQALLESPTFRSLWAQRVREHFYGDGPLTDAGLRTRWFEMRAEMAPSIPLIGSLFPRPWVSRRTQALMAYMADLDLLDPLNDLEPRATSSLAINEFMALNVSSASDELGEFEDWIEIYNLSGEVVDLSGMFLTDDVSVPTKWEFPAGTTIDPFGFLLVWADGDYVPGTLHTNFRLSADGEEIGLFDTLANGNSLLDQVEFGPQLPDVSEGRRPDGTGVFGALPLASPGTSNGTLPPVSNPGDYWVRADLQVGQGLRNVAIGDVNLDGNPDLVVTDYNFGRVAILLGNGPGTRTFTGPTYYPVGLGAKGLDLADLDSDGYPEIITANDGLLDYTVSTLRNNQDGTFAAPVSYPLFSMGTDKEFLHPQSLVTADINGDSHLDVVVANEAARQNPNFLSIFLNDGLGSGGLMGVSQLNTFGYSFDCSGRNLAALDLDGDSDTDLVTVTELQFLNVSLNRGDGTFEDPSVTPDSLSRPTSLVTADFDGDADIDVMSMDESTFLYLYRNQGDGTFAEVESVYITGSLRPEALAAADYNGDTFVDVAVALSTSFHGDSPRLRIFLNDGDGNFTADQAGSETPVSKDVLTYPQAIETADLDGDSRPDLAVADGTTGYLVVFFNETDSPTPPTPTPPPVEVEDWGRY